MNVQPVNLMVFREGRRDVSACRLQSHLVNLLRRSDAQISQEQKLKMLLLAGELECGVADALASDSAGNARKDPGSELIRLESVTDALAATLAGAELPAPNLAEALAEDPAETLEALAKTLEAIRLPDRISVSAPEGFAYYALHPSAYADAATALIQNSHAVAVIGIRSIGTTLSAAVMAAARRQRKKAHRTTVRPHGHPYNRELLLSAAELEFVERSKRADFLIVDEGPGLSGSSFLAVAEALVATGVPREKITLLCGHRPDFDALCASNASHRARQFRWLAVNSAPRLPQGATEFVGGGAWRGLFLKSESAWPAVWTSFERLKYRSAEIGGDSRFYKFLGFGHYGEAVLDRERQVAAAGFGPEPRVEENGFASYAWLQGRHMSSADLNEEVLDRLAQYCAFRASAFSTSITDVDSLHQMADHNLRELGFDASVQLELQRPVIADAHMQPHEWILTTDSHMLKTDSGSHGDDHFFPGPTDIAWDLAGAIVEWELSDAQADMLLEQYRSISGDDVRPRIKDFTIAYAIFRAAYCQMAASAMRGSDESLRLEQAALKYRKFHALRPLGLAHAI